MIAVLSHSHKVAVIDLERDHRFREFARATGRGIFADGREFKIVIREEELRGMIYDGVIIYGSPAPRLVDMAYARVK
jgi:hypothetical protein